MSDVGEWASSSENTVEFSIGHVRNGGGGGEENEYRKENKTTFFAEKWLSYDRPLENYDRRFLICAEISE